MNIVYDPEILGDESSVLAYMLYCGFDSPLLEKKLFTSRKKRLVFSKIRELKKEGKPLSVATLAEKLKDRKEVSIGYIHELEFQVMKSKQESHFTWHVGQLVRKKRELEIKKLVSSAVESPDFLPELKKVLDSYEPEEFEPVESFSISDHAEKLRGFIERKRRSEFWGLDIRCFPILTRMIMGLREIIVLVAEAKIGKSTFVLQVASDVAEQGTGVLYYDFENGRFNLMAREMCRKFKIGYRQELFSGEKEEDLPYPVVAALNSFKDHYKHFSIIADRGLTIDRIRSHLFQLRERTKEKNVLIVIDSLQKLPMKDLRDRRAAVDRWLRDFEELKAEDPNLTILMVSEVSREGRPKESGDIEYTGHFLLRLRKNKEREKPEDPEPEDDMRRKLYLEYARDVEAGKLIAIYEADFEYWRFIETEGFQ